VGSAVRLDGGDGDRTIQPLYACGGGCDVGGGGGVTGRSASQPSSE